MTADADGSGPAPVCVVRPYVPADAPRLVALQRKCLAACPDIDETSEAFYDNPAFDNGKNIFCAVPAGPTSTAETLLRSAPAGEAVVGPAPVTGEAVVGYGFVFRLPDPQFLYVDLKADPEHPEPGLIKDVLFDRVLARARDLAGSSPGLPVLLYGCYFTTGGPSLDYLASKGFTRRESLSVISMERALGDVMPKVPLPLGVELRPWPLDTEEERVRYLIAHNTALPYNYLDLDRFEYLLRVLETTTYGAFDGNEVAGSVTVYTQGDAGTIEYLFVTPTRQGQGIGRALVRAALRHFTGKGVTRARLDTGVDNMAARALYASMGFAVTREAVSLGLDLQS